MIQIIEHENGTFTVMEGGIVRCTEPIEFALSFLSGVVETATEYKVDMAVVEPVIAAEIFHLGPPMPHELWASCDGVMTHIADYPNKNDAVHAAEKIESGQYVVEAGLVRPLSDIETKRGGGNEERPA